MAKSKKPKCKKHQCNKPVANIPLARQYRLCKTHFDEHINKSQNHQTVTEIQCKFCGKSLEQTRNKVFCNKKCHQLSYFLETDEWKQLNQLFANHPIYFQKINQLEDIKKYYDLIERQIINNYFIQNQFFKIEWLLKTHCVCVPLTVLSYPEATDPTGTYTLVNAPTSLLVINKKEPSKNQPPPKDAVNLMDMIKQKFSASEIIAFFILLKENHTEKNESYFSQLKMHIIQNRTSSLPSNAMVHRNTIKHPHPVYSLLMLQIPTVTHSYFKHLIEQYHEHSAMGDESRVFCFSELLALTIFHSLLLQDEQDIIKKIINTAKELNSEEEIKNNSTVIFEKIESIFNDIVLYINHHFKMSFTQETCHDDTNFWQFYSLLFSTCENKTLNSIEEIRKNFIRINKIPLLEKT